MAPNPAARACALQLSEFPTLESSLPHTRDDLALTTIAGMKRLHAATQTHPFQRDRRPAGRAHRTAMRAAACLLPASVAVAGPSAAFQAACERQLPRAQVEVKVQPNEVTIVQTATVQELTGLRAQNELPDMELLGQARGSFHVAARYSGKTLFDPATGLTCQRVDVLVTVGVAPQQVTIASDFAKGSCAYQAILAHEMRHVQANWAQVESLAPVLRGELRAALAQRIFYGREADLVQQFRQQVLVLAETRALKLFEPVELAQRAIDSPEEYARNATLCDGEISRLLEAGPTMRLRTEMDALAARHRTSIAPLDDELSRLSGDRVMSVAALTQPAERERALARNVRVRELIAQRRVLEASLADGYRQLLDTRLPPGQRAQAVSTFMAAHRDRRQRRDDLDAAHLALLRVVDDTLLWAQRQTDLGSRNGQLVVASNRQRAEFEVFNERLVASTAVYNDSVSRYQAAVAAAAAEGPAAAPAPGRAGAPPARNGQAAEPSTGEGAAPRS